MIEQLLTNREIHEAHTKLERGTMKRRLTVYSSFGFVAIIGLAVGFMSQIAMAEQESETTANEEDSSRGLPDAYAKDYLIGASTISPNKKLAVIFPTKEFYVEFGDAHPERIKDLVVALQPFTVLGELKADIPYFKDENHGGISAEWSTDSSVALVTLDGKWGPRNVFLLEFAGGKLTRITDVLKKARDLVIAKFSKPKSFDLIFEAEEYPGFKLDGVNRVTVDGEAVTVPRGLAGWHAHLKAVWDIKRATFTERKIISE